MTTSDLVNLIAAILVGGGTLFLGIMAWRTIRQTRKINEKERRHRLLNEIIEWAIDAAELGYEESIISLPAASESGVDEYDMKRMILHTLSTIFAKCQTISTRSIYIETVASELSKNLGDAVTQVVYKLDSLKNLLSITIKKESKGITIPKGQELAELRQCAQCVIEEASKIKTRDIG